MPCHAISCFDSFELILIYILIFNIALENSMEVFEIQNTLLKKIHKQTKQWRKVSERAMTGRVFIKMQSTYVFQGTDCKTKYK